MIFRNRNRKALGKTYLFVFDPFLQVQFYNGWTIINLTKSIIIKLKMLIIPSKEALLISAEQNKQMFMLDPKTTAVVTKFREQNYFSTALAYYPFSKQFFSAQQGKTFVNIWDVDTHQPVLKVSIPQTLSYMTVSNQGNILFAGSSNGVLYVWDLPSGILLRKLSVHSNEIKKVINFKFGYLLTASKNEVKIWPLSAFLLQTQRSTPIKIINSILDIIDVQYERNMFIVLTNKGATYYLGGSQHNPFSQIKKQDLQYPTSLCVSLTHSYIGDFKGNIYVHELMTQNENLLSFNIKQSSEQIQIGRMNKKLTLTNPNKHSITCMVHLKTLPYLICGNSQGDITIWQNHQVKKSIKLFKTSIKFIKIIPKPKEGQKIPQKIKIKPLSKYEMSKQTEPLQLNFEQAQNYGQNQILDIITDASDDLILKKMMQVLSKPEQILKQQINRLQKQKDILYKANTYYCDLLNEDS